jgi:hypothetical protein
MPEGSKWDTEINGVKHKIIRTIKNGEESIKGVPLLGKVRVEGLHAILRADTTLDIHIDYSIDGTKVGDWHPQNVIGGSLAITPNGCYLPYASSQDICFVPMNQSMGTITTVGTSGSLCITSSSPGWVLYASYAFSELR